MGVMNVLVVARWPLGGIRTYMYYTYKHLRHDRFKLSIVASSGAEEDALRKDVAEVGGNLILVTSKYKNLGLIWTIFKLLCQNEFHVIQSHGFYSSTYVYIANMWHRIPHILTVHGIIEDRFMGTGIKSFLTNWLLCKAVQSSDVIYGVTQEIVQHVKERIPLDDTVTTVVIHNGIDTQRFSQYDGNHPSLREKLGIAESTFLIGFLGRFMPQKGFNYLIDAVELLEARIGGSREVLVLAVGSGDYLDDYKDVIASKNLTHRFLFLPFQRDVSVVYRSLDVAVIPSTWEAFCLQAAEAMCAGTPLIVSDCIGMREAVRGTPAEVVPSRDARGLAEAIHRHMRIDRKDTYQRFREQACARYDSRITAAKLKVLLEETARARS